MDKLEYNRENWEIIDIGGKISVYFKMVGDAKMVVFISIDRGRHLT